MTIPDVAVSPPPVASAAAVIYELQISHFRGIESLKWKPCRGVNVLLGGGDAGKSTILDAIGLLLSPTSSASVLDTDYSFRDVHTDFVIEAIVSLPSEGAINFQVKPSWPWEWKDGAAVVPTLVGDSSGGTEPVYKIRVRGTADLELIYELVQPDGSADHLSVGLRRSIGLVRMAGDDRGERDLRLVQGSALDRLLSDRTLRSRLASALASTDVNTHLSTEAREALAALEQAFAHLHLPSGLDISLVGGPGASIASLIGLRAKRDDISLPISSWGAGTRRLSALSIAAQNQGEHPITLVDEVERGLEPYRQRVLLDRLQAAQSQVFLTTHSPAAVAAAAQSHLWYLDSQQRIGLLAGAALKKHRAKDPEMFLARIAIVCEGITEVGFIRTLLGATLPQSLATYGIHLSDGGGHDTTLEILECLGKGGLLVGGFADDEGRSASRWRAVQESHGSLVFRWAHGCTEENIIALVPAEHLEAFITDPSGDETGERLRTLALRLGTAEKDFALLRDTAGVKLPDIVGQAARGYVPEGMEGERRRYKAHAQRWFKSEAGGSELATKVFQLGFWPSLRDQLLPFCNAVREAVGLEPVTDIQL